MKVSSCLPPAPNWNSSKAAVVSLEENLLAYASSNDVILLNAETLQYVGRFRGHTDKVNAVDFCDNLCASGGADTTIRCWDALTQKQTAILKNHKSEIYALAWVKDKKFIVSGDKSGDISIWNPSKNKSNKLYFIQSPIYNIASSPTVESSLAIGFQNGAIIVVKIDSDLNGRIARRLNGHDFEIQSLSWELPTGDCHTAKYTLLASGSRDKTIHIWNVEEECSVKTINLPHPMHHLTDQQKSRLWVAVTWIPERNSVITSSYIGHSRSVFSIVTYACGTKAITVSMDRKIILWDLTQKKPIFTVSCIHNYVNDIDVSVVDPHRLAIASGDNNIRVWDIANKHDPFSCTLYWKGLKNKLTCIKCHPNREGFLAFGTDLGNIGWYEIYNDKSKTFNSYHKGKVYSIQWCKPEWLGLGSAIENSDHSLIISCGGDGQILLSDTTKPKQSVIVNDMIKEANPEWTAVIKDKSGYLPKRTEISVHPAGRFLAIGNFDGSIEVYDLPSFKIVYHNIGHRSIINKLEWRHLDDAGNSFSLASGSDDNLIMIHDFSDLNKLISTTTIPTSSCKQVFEMHKKGVTDLSWSPSDSNKLVSSSFDGTAIVWDIQLGIPISMFRGHHGRLLCTVWSLEDEDAIFTGGDDAACFCWKISENFYEPLKDFSPEIKSNVTPSDAVTKDNMSQPLDETILTALDKIEHTATHTKIDAPEPIQKVEVRASKKKKFKNLLPLGTSPSRRKNLQYSTFDIARKLYGGDIDKAMEFWVDNEHKGQKLTDETDNTDIQAPPFVELFFDEGNKSRKLIEQEIKSHNNSGISMSLGGLEVSPTLPLQMWSNNFAELIKSYEDNAEFSNKDWILLALSPLAGRDVWQSLVRLQAEKLVAKNDRHGAVLCWLACGEVYEAVEVYRKAEMYREAIALAKLRLIDEDPIFSDLYSLWAIQLEKEEAYEQAAMCHLAAKKENSIHHALNALSRRGDPSALRTAASLALMLGDSSAEERISRYFEDQEIRSSKK
ncbi:quinon protein alcohol dehydrogenase-like superfamily [Gigaspora rosea]|uniref:Quinon protein alcohol dehydrogenase-like superfamily n=1 Tax=Gigaspora rosea TaxID=44941 RepID=A0A397V6T3_9GLOM|nr:quinon protein alcohol dehydrogenase-like superfamily [Gigaspora rosea]